MMSSSAVRVRKPAVERREEIVAAAAAIALEHGLERITLRAVAERLGVRPGLITHYFPAVDDLVAEAFARAADLERDRFFPGEATGDPVAGVRHFLGHIQSGASLPLARMWLNARHLCRFVPALAHELDEQDRLDRARLVALVGDGIAAGAFAATDAEDASMRMLLAVDGVGSYANADDDAVPAAHVRFLVDSFAAALGIEARALAPA